MSYTACGAHWPLTSPVPAQWQQSPILWLLGNNSERTQGPCQTKAHVKPKLKLQGGSLVGRSGGQLRDPGVGECSTWAGKVNLQTENILYVSIAGKLNEELPEERDLDF